MSSKRKWLRKSNVLSALNSHTNLWNVVLATNYSANIVKCNSLNIITSKKSMLIMILITDQADGEVLVELSMPSLHLLEEAAEINNLNLH